MSINSESVVNWEPKFTVDSLEYILGEVLLLLQIRQSDEPKTIQLESNISRLTLETNLISKVTVFVYLYLYICYVLDN